MEILKTPDSCFTNLPGYSFQANYINVGDDDLPLMMHYVDYGDKDSPIILMLHGEPSWSYLYRHMIDTAVESGFRVLAPDLIGFGKSDKPASQQDYSYSKHLYWLETWLNKLGVSHLNLICQDWGGLLGLRLVAEKPELFDAVVAANTFLPTGHEKVGQAFLDWQHYAQNTDNFDIGAIIQRATTHELIHEVQQAYNAPYPEEKYKAGARQFPMLVPISPEDPESENNVRAWEVLKQFEKPFLTLFSDQDPITKGAEKVFQKLIPGCKNQKHAILKNGGHFLQEDCPEELIMRSIICFKEQ